METFEECISVNTIMNDFEHPWLIAGGWAIDLFLAEQTREHGDIEIVVMRDDQLALQQYLHDWTFHKAVAGHVSSWSTGERLELPIHETYAEKDGEKLEILLNECDGGQWIYRRDARVTRSFKQIFMFSEEGLPFLAPEIVLLYKSKVPREKDELDFENALPLLDDNQRLWLKHALETVYGDHAWLGHL